MAELVSDLGRGQGRAADSVRRFSWHQRVHDRKINGIRIACIETHAQRDRSCNQLARAVPLIIAGSGAFGIVAREADSESEMRVVLIKGPLVASRFGRKKLSLPIQISSCVFLGDIFYDAFSLL